MNIKVGDIIVPKYRTFLEEAYDIKYRVEEIDESDAFDVARLSIIVGKGSFKELAEEIKRDVHKTLEGLPPWVDVQVKVNKFYYDFIFSEEDWIKVGDVNED